MKTVLTFLFVTASAFAGASENRPSPWSVPLGFGGVTCSGTVTTIPDLPFNYYGIELVPTRRVPGTGEGRGLGKVTFSRSPYGVAVSPSGNYVVDVAIRVERIKRPEQGVLTAWATKDDLTEVVRLGSLDDSFRASGSIGWNKFLLVVTLEPSDEPGPKWTGPIVMRGMSRSGLMHTLAGHGPYQKEPCAKYGFR